MAQLAGLLADLADELLGGQVARDVDQLVIVKGGAFLNHVLGGVFDVLGGLLCRGAVAGACGRSAGSGGCSRGFSGLLGGGGLGLGLGFYLGLRSGIRIGDGLLRLLDQFRQVGVYGCKRVGVDGEEICCGHGFAGKIRLQRLQTDQLGGLGLVEDGFVLRIGCGPVTGVGDAFDGRCLCCVCNAC